MPQRAPGLRANSLVKFYLEILVTEVKHRLGRSNLYPVVLKLCLGAGENCMFHRVSVK